MIFIEFCAKCGGLLVRKKSRRGNTLVCRVCGKASKLKSKNLKISISTPKKSGEIVIVEKKMKFEALPKTSAQCPKCEHNEAFWWMQQTRSADEAPTRFYKCCKCGHIWREYE